jgi:TatD DNase family protein
VQKILLPNIDSTSIGPMNELVRSFPGICHAMMGLHPTSVKENFRQELEIIEKELKKGTYEGVGEIGIDLYWDKTFLKEQQITFAAQLDLSLHHDLPVVIHARESFGEILDVLEGYKNKGLKGIFHAYTGDVDTAKKIAGMGFHLGIGGILTYKKSTLPEVVRETDLHKLVLETDSPYLSPVPHRGKRNESAYIPFIAEAIGQIKNLSLNEVATITTENVLNLFSLDHG